MSFDFMTARPIFFRAALALTLVLLACAGRPPEAKEARETPRDISIGDTALAQGGIGALGGPGVSETTAGTLRANMVDKTNPVKLDGLLGEWPARTAARIEVKGSAGASLAFLAAVQYDERFLYVAGEVTEESFVRTARFGEGEDHAALVLAFPSGGGLAAYEVGLFAGKPGESAGSVRFAGGRKGAVDGARIVEAPTGKGYTFEAAIPWSAFPEARHVRVGLRAAARYYSSDGSAAARVILSTSSGDAHDPRALAPLLTEPEQSIVDGVLTEKGLAAQAPSVDLFVDVAGDSMKERVSVWGSYLTICGPGYRAGKEYFYKDLGAEVVRLEARDLTGRGKEDLVLRRRVVVEGANRDWFEVLSVLKGDEPTTIFSHEISIARDGKRVSNAVHVGSKQIDVSVEPAIGWDASSYREAPVDGVEPLLLPWGSTRAESFRFDGDRFTKAHEDRRPSPTRAAASSSDTPTGAGPTLPSRSAEPTTPPVVVTPRSPSAGTGTDSVKPGDIAGRLLAQYRRDQGVSPDVRPKVDIQVQVDGDPRPERVVLVGKDIVVSGAGFKGGAEYAFLTLSQFDSPADIQDMTARDLTGDGAADLVVRGTRRVTAEGSSAPLELDAIFVYRVKAGMITRIFAIETGRSQAGKRAQGQVQFVPAKDGHGFQIDVRPGRVTGWTEKSYPWSQEKPGTGMLEPLLLPWGSIPSLRYGWNGSAFTRL
jgi:hypothetical protein